MFIITENELIHTDSTSDVIEHFGVKGMKWGARKAGSYAKEYAKASFNSVRHPILNSKGMARSASNSVAGTYLGSHRSLKYRNKVVSDMVKAKKDWKNERKRLMNDEGNQLSKMDTKNPKRKAGESRKDYKSRIKEHDRKIAERENQIENTTNRKLKTAKKNYKRSLSSAGGNYYDN